MSTDSSTTELECQKIVAELEEEFKYRFTDEDEEYKAITSQSTPPPPAIIPWAVRPKRNYDWSSNNRGEHWNKHRQRNYHDDYRHSRRSGGGGGGGYQNQRSYYHDDRYGGHSGHSRHYRGSRSSVSYQGQHESNRHHPYRKN